MVSTVLASRGEAELDCRALVDHMLALEDHALVLVGHTLALRSMVPRKEQRKGARRRLAMQVLHWWHLAVVLGHQQSQ